MSEILNNVVVGETEAQHGRIIFSVIQLRFAPRPVWTDYPVVWICGVLKPGDSKCPNFSTTQQSSGTARAYLLGSSRERAVGASRVQSPWCQVLGSTWDTSLKALARVAKCQDHNLTIYPCRPKRCLHMIENRRVISPHRETCRDQGDEVLKLALSKPTLSKLLGRNC